MIHIQIIFCNNYFNLNLPLDPYTRGRYNSQLQSALVTTYGLPAGRIQGLFVVQDPASGRLVMQFDIMPGPGMSSNDIELFISNRVTARTFSLTDMFNNVLSVNCYDLPVPPKKPNNNLLWLLTIPAAVALLSLLLCCFFCWNRQCCCFAQGGGRVKVVEVIDEDVYQDVDARSIRSVRSCRSVGSQPSLYSLCGAPMMMNDPGSTYYHSVGRPFAVAFNDNTFSAVGYATNDQGFYTTTGAKRAPSLCGDEEIHVIVNRRGSCGSDYGGYHSAGMGNRYAPAYNDRTFNTYSSMPRYDRVCSYN